MHGAGEGEGEDEGQGGLHEESRLGRWRAGGWRTRGGEYAVSSCTCDERLEDFGTEEGAVDEDVAGCWGEEFEAGGGHVAGELGVGG